MSIANWPMKGVWGWRGIVGVITPDISSGWLYQWFYEVAPDGMGLETTSLEIEAITDEQLERGLTRLDVAAKLLANEGVKFISLFGTPVGLAGGLEEQKRLARRVEEITKLPGSTTLLNAVNALKALSAKKIIVATPFQKELNRRHEKFWGGAGFEVVNVKGLGLTRGIDIRRLPYSAFYNLAKEAYLETPGADAIYIAGGPLGPPSVIECLEKDLGKPVVASVQAFIWNSLKVLNIKESPKGFGALFDLK